MHRSASSEKALARPFRRTAAGLPGRGLCTRVRATPLPRKAALLSTSIQSENKTLTGQTCDRRRQAPSRYEHGRSARPGTVLIPGPGTRASDIGQHPSQMPVGKRAGQGNKRIPGADTSSGIAYSTPQQASPDSSMLHRSTISSATTRRSERSRPERAAPLSRRNTTAARMCPHNGCGTRFITAGDLKKHLRAHSLQKPFVCSRERCRRSFTTSRNLTQHLRVHAEEKPFVCLHEGCLRSFAKKYNMNRHWRVHTGEKPFVCSREGCGRSFAGSTDLKRHWRIHTGEKPFVCLHEGCGRAFTQSSSRRAHWRHHRGEKPYACRHEGCGYAATTSGDLTKHRHAAHSHKGSGAAFTRSTYPMPHLRIRSGTKPYVCPWRDCFRAFTVSSHLARHLRTHSGEKPFRCRYKDCGSAFSQSSGLAYHLRIHTGEKDFVCPHEGCGQAFTQPGTLTTHTRTHSREKPFVCPHEGCRYSAAQSSNLKSHLLRHSGQRTFTCPREDCAKGFRHIQSMTRHLKAHKAAQPCVGPDAHDKKRLTPRYPGLARILPPPDASGYRCSPTTGKRPCRLTPSLKARRHRHASTAPRPDTDRSSATKSTGTRMLKPRCRLRTHAPQAPGYPFLKRSRRHARLRIHKCHDTAPARDVIHNGTANHYCSVIAWVSGGVVHHSRPPEQQKPG